MHRIAVQRILALAFVLTGILEHELQADVPSPAVVLTPAAKGLVVGPGMHAVGKDLRGCQFVTQDLTGAVFDRCNLYAVRIDSCILKRASFRGAVFTGANVEVGPDDEGADFTDATINGVWQGGAEGFHSYGLELSPKQLMSTWSYKNKDLHECSIRGSYRPGEAVVLDFRGADLTRANLSGDLSKCDFTNARIYGALFGNDTITFDQLASTLDFKQRSIHVRICAGKGLRGSSGKWDFSRIGLQGSNLWLPQPDVVVFTDARIGGCTIRGALTTRQLYSTASYKQGNLTRVRLDSADLSDCDLSGMNLTDASFEHCRIARAKFEDAVISGASFLTGLSTAEPDRLTVAQVKSTWNYKHGRMAGIRLPEDIAEALKKQ